MLLQSGSVCHFLCVSGAEAEIFLVQTEEGFIVALMVMYGVYIAAESFLDK